jgi:putative ABC transport system substrate-binding protein
VPPIVARATDRIPIVVIGGDPVAGGLVDSTARPGRNVTGVKESPAELDAKILEALVELVPNARRMAWFANFGVGSPANKTAFAASAEKLHLEVLPLDIRQASDLEPAFERASDWPCDVMYAANVVPLNVPRERLARLALQWRIPSGSGAREWVQAGSLIAYSTPGRFLGQRAAWYVARILEGANPAEMPVESAMVFDVVVNRSTLAYLGLTLPTTVAETVTEWVA